MRTKPGWTGDACDTEVPLSLLPLGRYPEELRDGLTCGNPAQKVRRRKRLFYSREEGRQPQLRVFVKNNDAAGWGEACPVDIKMNSEITTTKGLAPA